MFLIISAVEFFLQIFWLYLQLLKDKEIINKSTYQSIKPVGSRPGILYGLGKIHKETRNGIPPFAQFFQLLVHLPTYS